MSPQEIVQRSHFCGTRGTGGERTDRRVGLSVTAYRQVGRRVWPACAGVMLLFAGCGDAVGPVDRVMSRETGALGVQPEVGAMLPMSELSHGQCVSMLAKTGEVPRAPDGLLFAPGGKQVEVEFGGVGKKTGRANAHVLISDGHACGGVRLEGETFSVAVRFDGVATGSIRSGVLELEGDARICPEMPGICAVFAVQVEVRPASGQHVDNLDIFIIPTSNPGAYVRTDKGFGFIELGGAPD